MYSIHNSYFRSVESCHRNDIMQMKTPYPILHSHQYIFTFAVRCCTAVRFTSLQRLTSSFQYSSPHPPTPASPCEFSHPRCRNAIHIDPKKETISNDTLKRNLLISSNRQKTYLLSTTSEGSCDLLCTLPPIISQSKICPIPILLRTQPLLR